MARRILLLLLLLVVSVTLVEAQADYRQWIQRYAAPGQAEGYWILGLRGQAGPAASSRYPDTLVLVTPQETQKFSGSLGSLAAGLHPGRLDLVELDSESQARLQELLGDNQFRYLIMDPSSPTAVPQPVPRYPWAGLPAVQRFNAYQSLLLARGGKLVRDQVCVLGLRGLAPSGALHSPAINQGAYDDTFVVLRRDAQGRALIWEFPGSTHAGDPSDEDAPANGVAQIRPGHYRAVPNGIHHGQPCWSVLTPSGSGRIPCWRDADRDGWVSLNEQSQPSTATYILFHDGLYEDMASSIGCLTLPPAVYPDFVSAIGPKNAFNFSLIQADDLSLPTVTEYELGRTVANRPIKMQVLGQGPRIALYFATIHGDEDAGTDLLDRLRQYLLAHPQDLQGWEVRLIPRLNLDSQVRTNARGVDLNRNFPTLWGRSSAGAEHSGPAPLSEPETRSLRYAVLGLSPGPAGRPERIISLHQHHGIPSGEGWLDGDGPPQVEALVQSLLGVSQGRLTSHKIGDSQGRLRIPGSFGTWVSSPEVAIPTITLELSREDNQPDRNWDNYFPALLQLLKAN